MKNTIKKIAAVLLALLLMLPLGLVADAAPYSLSVVTKNVQFPAGFSFFDTTVEKRNVKIL